MTGCCCEHPSSHVSVLIGVVKLYVIKRMGFGYKQEAKLYTMLGCAVTKITLLLLKGQLNIFTHHIVVVCVNVCVQG